MYTVNPGKIEIDFAGMDQAAHYIPSGAKVWDGRKEHFNLQGLRCFRALRDSKRLERSLELWEKGIYTSSVNTSTLDEAPMAYKSISDILRVIAETLDVIEVLKPVYNFKVSQ